MDNKHLKDEELIEMLRQMPTIQDERPREVVYERLQEAMGSQPRTKRKRKSKSFPFWPMVATAAALFLVFVLGSSLLSQKENYTTMDSSKREMASEPEKNSILIQEEPGMDGSNPAGAGEVEIKNVDEEKQDNYLQGFTAIYPNQLTENNLVVTLAIPDSMGQNAIPVSVIVEKSPDKVWIDYYNEVMNQIQEGDLGLSDYYPYQGSLYLDDSGKLSISLNPGYASNWGSAGEGLFFESLDAFRFQNINEIYLYEDGQPGIQTQKYSEPLEVYSIPLQKRIGYMIYQSEDHTYLAPTPASFDDLETAFATMKTEIPTHQLQPSIPVDLEFTYSRVEDELTIQFQEGTVLKDSQTTSLTLEAMLLTAKEFGYASVKFENAGLASIGGFDLTNPIPVPVAPNQVEMDLAE